MISSILVESGGLIPNKHLGHLKITTNSDQIYFQNGFDSNFQLGPRSCMLTCTWPFPKSMYGPNMQFTSDGDVRVPINPTCMF